MECIAGSEAPPKVSYGRLWSFQMKLSNAFCFKDRLPFDLVSGVVYKYTCDRCNSTYYGEMDRHLKVRSG